MSALPLAIRGGLKSGSYGARTRHLRRDRPSRALRRTATNVSERGYLQALSPSASLSSAWLSQSLSRRLGHEWAARLCLGRQHSARESSNARSDTRTLAESAAISCVSAGGLRVSLRAVVRPERRGLREGARLVHATRSPGTSITTSFTPGYCRRRRAKSDW